MTLQPAERVAGRYLRRLCAYSGTINHLISSGTPVPDIFQRSPNARGRDFHLDHVFTKGFQWVFAHASPSLFDVSLSELKRTFERGEGGMAHEKDREWADEVRKWFQQSGPESAMVSAPILAIASTSELAMLDGNHRLYVWHEMMGTKPIPTLIGYTQAEVGK